MNKSGFEIEGFDELLQNIEDLGGNIEKEGRKALREAGSMLRDELEKNTPKQVKSSGVHAKDNVVVSNVKTNKETGDKYISVGYPKGIKHRIHFIEIGTLRQAPQLFMTKTMNSMQNKVKKTMADSLKGALKK